MSAVRAQRDPASLPPVDPRAIRAAVSRRAGLSYLPGLDGLRALAVLAVLAYHADQIWLPGGFLGVDVFFVISGFLITSLLIEEWQVRGTVNLTSFWLRRIRRLVPAVVMMVVATLCYAVAFLPNEIARLRSDSLAALTYVTNWYLILSQQSYFEAIGRPSLLRHLWSLAVEGQFYLVWPPVFVVVMRRWHPRGVLLGALTLCVGSAALMAALYDPEFDPSRVYYGSDTRAGGLLAGVALAFFLTQFSSRVFRRAICRRRRRRHRCDGAFRAHHTYVQIGRVHSLPLSGGVRRRFRRHCPRHRGHGAPQGPIPTLGTLVPTAELAGAALLRNIPLALADLCRHSTPDGRSNRRAAPSCFTPRHHPVRGGGFLPVCGDSDSQRGAG